MQNIVHVAGSAGEFFPALASSWVPKADLDQRDPDYIREQLPGLWLLASLGIYGVMAFTVAQRTPEIGLRMALGAGQSQVRLQILREGLTLAAGGLALGLLGAYALGRAMQSTLYGTGALSLPVLLVVSLVRLGAALIACYVPARRASAVDPMTALRQE